ncbi:hypothetical protein B0H12DRAFT_1238035 [Mycena haematopus]|nr:hypothetical protein B0H12DRAFT_1238035 [Mycena haematopus]
MPLFTSSSGFRIDGGHFYEIAGDMNIHGTQPMIGQGSDPLTALKSGLNVSTRLVGEQRIIGRQVEAASMLPSDLDRWPRRLGLGDTLDFSRPIHPAHTLGEYSSTHDQDRTGRRPQEERNRSNLDVPGPSFPARDHRTNINIGG